MDGLLIEIADDSSAWVAVGQDVKAGVVNTTLHPWAKGVHAGEIVKVPLEYIRVHEFAPLQFKPQLSRRFKREPAAREYTHDSETGGLRRKS
jgi:hypothetical protein